MPGTPETAVMIAAPAPGRRSSHQTPATKEAEASITTAAFARRKSDSLMKTLSAESDFAPKSCSTVENCGNTNRMKNSMTQAAAIRTKAGYCIASVSLRRISSARARSQHLEHLIECARDFADSYKCYIHGGKQGRVIRNRSGETFSGQKCRPQFT